MKGVYYTTTYVLPIIEYASLIWFDRKQGTRDMLERIQRRFTRTILGIPPNPAATNYKDYPTRLKILEMETLAQRREISRSVFGLKVARGLIRSNELSQLLVPSPVLRFTREHRPYIVKVVRSAAYYRRPMVQIADTLNFYSNKVSLEKSIESVRNQLKKRFRERREVGCIVEEEFAVQ